MTVTTDVSASDPEVQPNLKIKMGPPDTQDSYFQGGAVTAPGIPPGAVSIALNTLVGNPERLFSLITTVWTHIKTDAS